MLIYIVNTSVDGYIEDAHGSFDFTEPSDEVHAFINDLVRPIGTHLLGRRMYETMAVWETDPSIAESSPISADFAAIWQGADKVVYSRTLESVSTTRTRLERDFDPDAVRQLIDSAGHDLAIAGSDLAAHAFRAGLVEECHLFVTPLVVGAGKPAIATPARLDLDLLDERRFANGTVYLRYRVATGRR